MDDAESPEPVSSVYTEEDLLALRVREAIRAAAALIPGLELPHPTTRRRSHRTVRNEQILDMAALVEGDAELTQLGTFDVAEARGMVRYQHAFTTIADQIEFLAQSVRFTMEARKSRVVAAALQTYAIANAMARNADSAGLASRLEVIRKVMRISRTRRKTKKTE